MDDQIQQTAEEIAEQLPDGESFPDGTTATVEEIGGRLDTLVNEYSVPLNEATTSVEGHYSDELGNSNSSSPEETAQDSVYDIGNLASVHDGQEVAIRGKVTREFDLSDAQAEYFDQSGIIGDDTGTVPFSVASEAVEESSSLTLDVGETYLFEGVSGDGYDGISLIITEQTAITPIDESFNPPVQGSDESEQINLDELNADHDGEWLSVRGTVEGEVDLNENEASWVSQRVVLGDNTGTTTFTIPDNSVESNSNLHLETGCSYELNSIVGDEFDGRVSIQATPNTTIEKIEESYTVPDDTETIRAPMVAIENGSGLIKRCPVGDDTDDDDTSNGCGRMVENGTCAEHGTVDGFFDLRIKCVLDNGREAKQVFLDKDATEFITGHTMEDAIEIAEEALSREQFISDVKDTIMGHYYRVEGEDSGQYLIAKSIDPIMEPDWESEVDTFETGIESLSTVTTSDPPNESQDQPTEKKEA